MSRAAKRTPRMEARAVQPAADDVAAPPAPDPRDAELERLRARIAELETGPQTLTEVAALVEAACGERDLTRRQMNGWIAEAKHCRAALVAIRGTSTLSEAQQIASDALAEAFR